MNILELIKDCEVEWKSLGEVAELKRGKTITAKQVTIGDIPVISGGQKPAYYTGEFNREGKTITVAGSGAYAGFLMYWETPIFVGDAFSIQTDESVLSLKYVFHFLLSKQQLIFNMKKGSGVPHVYPKDVATLQIPIPSLEIQKKIVKTLDIFTKLEAELSLRVKQYNYYRNDLLTFGDDVEFITLDKISENLNSMRKPIKSGLREKGRIPYYGASGIVDYVEDYIFDDEILLISEDGANLIARNTPIAFSVLGKCWVNNHAHVLKFKTDVERKFVEFYLNNLDLSPFISGAALPKQNLNKIPIPNITFVTQQKIVEILDKFDRLTNSISDGLPKEIDLRRKQYEYYRERLLGFNLASI
ncbi:restriction endonuclease subunit S [Actinobacillus pleuropneumoniae]|uniref:restriction endonuclease subunit S n=1 Tax=Actinobacillus pleuropneumoniae TaxID=715 RepID=UPI003CFF2442